MKAMTDTQPTITVLPERHYVAIPASVTMDMLGAVVPPLNGEVFRWLAERGIAPAGPPFWRYNVIDMARLLAMEAGVTVATAITGDERVQAGILPAGRYATLRHTGAPDTLVAATITLRDWAAAEGLKWDMSQSADGEVWGCRLENYLTDPDDEPDLGKWVTELAYRLAD
jgi:effector-binding domain-containing protein